MTCEWAYSKLAIKTSCGNIIYRYIKSSDYSRSVSYDDFYQDNGYSWLYFKL